MMTPFSRDLRSAFTLVEALVIVVIVGVLVFVVLQPAINRTVLTGNLTGTLSNARQLQIATQMMTLDMANAGEGTQGTCGKQERMEWTCVRRKGNPPVPATLAEYLGALMRENYLTKQDLRKVLSAPGIVPDDRLSADSIAFRFFVVDEASPSDQPLVVTANWRDGRLMTSGPYRKMGFVVFSKGGSGGIFKRTDAAGDPALFPVGKGFRSETLR